MDYILLIFACMLAVWGIYTSFVIIGGLAGKFLTSYTFRLIATIALCLVFPLATGLGSLGESTLFHQRLRRIATTVTVLTLGSSIAFALLLTRHTVPKMYSQPNWAFGNSKSVKGPLREFNRSYTLAVANLAETVAFDIGLYPTRPRPLGEEPQQVAPTGKQTPPAVPKSTRGKK